MLSKKSLATVTGLTAAAVGILALTVTGILGAGSASAEPAATQPGVVAAAPQPPKGARAEVQVSPNPTTKPGAQVTITGNCGGGLGLKQVIGGSPEHPMLENIKIVNADPAGFLATATVSQKIGNGVGPVLVDCGGEAGVTLLVTHA